MSIHLNMASVSPTGGRYQQLLDEQKMTRDGITADSLLTIYRELYSPF